MVPTLLGVLAAVLVVVAVQVQVRAVREPGLADRHGEAYAAYAARTGRFLPRRPRDPDPRPSRAALTRVRARGQRSSSSYGTAASCSATSAGSASSGSSVRSPVGRRRRPSSRRSFESATEAVSTSTAIAAAA